MPFLGRVAQGIERRAVNPKVEGSNPSASFFAYLTLLGRVINASSTLTSALVDGVAKCVFSAFYLCLHKEPKIPPDTKDLILAEAGKREKYGDLKLKCNRVCILFDSSLLESYNVWLVALWYHTTHNRYYNKSYANAEKQFVRHVFVFVLIHVESYQPNTPKCRAVGRIPRKASFPKIQEIAVHKKEVLRQIFGKMESNTSKNALTFRPYANTSREWNRRNPTLLWAR